jgi:ABC-type Fe3+-siderophore transport system permease subunit
MVYWNSGKKIIDQDSDMRKRISRYLGSLICLLIIFHLSSCFKLSIKSSAKNSIEKLQNLEREKNWDQLCSLARTSSEGSSSSFESYRFAGLCYRYGYGDLVIDYDLAEKFYQKSVICGSEQGKNELIEFAKDHHRNINMPEMKYRLDDTLFFGGNMESVKCGYTGNVTGVGYVLIAPLMLPLAVIALPVGILLAVAGFSLQLLMIPFK